MNIVLTTDLIHTGGAETFVLRLAQALGQKKNNVRLFLFYQKRTDHDLTKLVAPDVPAYFARIPLLRFFEKTDSFLRICKIDFSFVQFFIKRSWYSFLKKHNIEIVHTHLFTADFIACTVKRKYQRPVISTMHGDYEFYNAELKAGKRLRILNYSQKENFVLNSLDHLVYITAQQKLFFKSLSYFKNIEHKLTKIYNGYPTPNLASGSETNKTSLERFVIGMVSRGVKEKGWEVLIKAFIEAHIPNSLLKLIGAGEFLDHLKDKYRQNKNISFEGKVLNPLPLIQSFDVACLPSLFKTESLPTVLIEYLVCEKPIIASRVGEIPEMLGDGTDFPCGILIEQSENMSMVNELKEALIKLYNDKRLYYLLKENTRKATAKFDMNLCVEHYEKLYDSSVR